MDDAKTVRLRRMTPAEYRASTERREAEMARELAAFLPEDLALERARQGSAQFLPNGADTAGHHLMAAEDADGRVVGEAWIGPDPRQALTGGNSAWLYDLYVSPEVRRRGYGSAVLRAAEALTAREGWTALGLNVFGGNEAAIALYRASGYRVAAMSLHKEI
ncbi:GNAT family N-acetyltransferase [Kitasatospora cheerisanensis]|uniref:Acetyltransferase GCN5 n=1 Tax=Kitasatospora cheerisanensis KCTC 2395 TaxID=1348663 RepID=A0A066Z9R1_9ACTN|nr:GNAT family N-acetyltransferase [Kitasatospora cheerisanensis]KDN87051.1 acetyltransferase GCN5 [Kitasatospora cheerisanensis KCTC 2395]